MQIHVANSIEDGHKKNVVFWDLKIVILVITGILKHLPVDCE